VTKLIVAFLYFAKAPNKMYKNERVVVHNACLMYRIPSGVLYSLVNVFAVDFFVYYRNLVFLNPWVTKLFCVDH